MTMNQLDAQSGFKHKNHADSMPTSTLLAERNLAKGKKKSNST